MYSAFSGSKEILLTAVPLFAIILEPLTCKSLIKTTESPALRIMDLLEYKGAKINYHDPYVERVGTLKNLDLTKNTIEEQDAIVIITDHTNVDYISLGKYAKLIVDTRNIMATVKNPRARVIRA